MSRPQKPIPYYLHFRINVVKQFKNHIYMTFENLNNIIDERWQNRNLQQERNYQKTFNCEWNEYLMKLEEWKANLIIGRKNKEQKKGKEVQKSRKNKMKE